MSRFDYPIADFKSHISEYTLILQPDFRWPAGADDESGAQLDAFGLKVLKFQVVLAGYSLGFGLWYSARSLPGAT